MQYFYDGQLRRYITQTIRVLSNFTVKYGDGSLHRVPVMYGDADRQAANIIKQNSENKINSVPRMSVYISNIDLDRDRLSDATYVGKVHIRERDFAPDPISGRNTYNQAQGRNYTVERLMPTPFKLDLKVDIWTASTEQKLQILEQILVLFNPSLELQTSDNFVDWASLTVLNLKDVNWSSKSVPVGTDTPIDIATLTFDTPVWISPPVKVKQLGVITNIITSLFENTDKPSSGYIDGLGVDTANPSATLSAILFEERITITDYKIEIYNSKAVLLGKSENVVPAEPTLNIPERQGTPINWEDVLEKYPGKYIAGASKLYLIQSNGVEIVGTVALDPSDSTTLIVNWDSDSLVKDTLIDSYGNIFGDIDFDQTSARGKIDAIIDPLTYNPKRPLKEIEDQPIITGIRYLIIEDIGNEINVDGADAWKSLAGTDFVAHANDLIEWNGSQWNVIFDSTIEKDIMIWQTNIYTGVQYLWNGVSWVKSFEGIYNKGRWRLEL